MGDLKSPTPGSWTPLRTWVILSCSKCEQAIVYIKITDFTPPVVVPMGTSSDSCSAFPQPVDEDLATIAVVGNVREKVYSMVFIGWEVIY